MRAFIVPRLLHRLYANLMGYFWLPCPRCGEFMGGHEWKHTGIGVLTETPGLTKGVCNKCAVEIQSRHPKGAEIHLDPSTFAEIETGTYYLT